jgi:MFS family permease
MVPTSMSALVAGIFSLSAIVLRPIAGRMGDRGSRKTMVIARALVAAASLGAPIFVTSIWQMTLLRLLNGVGEAFFFTGAVTAVADGTDCCRRPHRPARGQS